MATQYDTTDAYPKLPTVGLNIPSQNIDPLESVYGQNKTYFQTKLVWTCWS